MTPRDTWSLAGFGLLLALTAWQQVSLRDLGVALEAAEARLASLEDDDSDSSPFQAAWQSLGEGPRGAGRAGDAGGAGDRPGRRAPKRERVPLDRPEDAEALATAFAEEHELAAEEAEAIAEILVTLQEDLAALDEGDPSPTERAGAARDATLAARDELQDVMSPELTRELLKSIARRRRERSPRDGAARPERRRAAD